MERAVAGGSLAEPSNDEAGADTTDHFAFDDDASTRATTEIVNFGCRLNISEGEAMRRAAGEADAEETPTLTCAAKLLAAETKAKKAVKDAQAALDEAVLRKYADLTEDEIRALVVQDKWQADLETSIAAEVEARTESLTARVRILTERYGRTLPDLVDDLEVLEAKMMGHLKAMGFVK